MRNAAFSATSGRAQIGSTRAGVNVETMNPAKRCRTSTPQVLWNRDEILCCHCSELSTRHTHCPCDLCCGKAVARSTEYRHWIATQELIRHNRAECIEQNVTLTHVTEEQGDLVEREVDTNIEPTAGSSTRRRVPDSYLFVEPGITDQGVVSAELEQRVKPDEQSEQELEMLEQEMRPVEQQHEVDAVEQQEVEPIEQEVRGSINEELGAEEEFDGM